MSHFTCLIIGDDIESQLAPYDENITVAPYKSYETGEPKDFWAVNHLREEGFITATDDELTWADICTAYTKRYPPEDGDDGVEIDENGMYSWSTYNPSSKWDYWRIGGRWAGYFTLKPGCAGEQPVELSYEWNTEWANSPEERAEMLKQAEEAKTRADVARKGAIDIDGMRQSAADKAATTWDEVHEAIDGTPECLPWKHFLDRVNESYTIQQARDDYAGQPRVTAFREFCKTKDWFLVSLEDYDVERSLFIERARASAIPGYATVYEGKWIAPGDMGWWGMSTDNASDRAGYLEYVNGLVDKVSDDTLFTVVDCHV